NEEVVWQPRGPERGWSCATGRRSCFLGDASNRAFTRAPGAARGAWPDAAAAVSLPQYYAGAASELRCPARAVSGETLLSAAALILGLAHFLAAPEPDVFRQTWLAAEE